MPIRSPEFRRWAPVKFRFAGKGWATGTRWPIDRSGIMEMGRFGLRSPVWVLVVAFLALSAQPARVQAQWKGPPADRAELLWRQGYTLHVLGAYEQAIVLFHHSIEARPTAEGHTFLGWSLGQIGRLKEAIAECRKAIAIDRDFGNPYNDIGVYLVQLGRADEAIPWLKKAMRARRYCCYQFPHFNLGQILLKKGKAEEARRLFERALKYDPDYAPAKEALEEIRKSWL